MADVHCPEKSDIRPMSDCLECCHHVENGTSLEWCRFKKEEAPRTEMPINALRMQMEEKISKAEYLYRRGRTKQADVYSYEAASLYRVIKQRERTKITS